MTGASPPNLIERFDTAFLISLPDRTDRRAALRADFESTIGDGAIDRLTTFDAIRPDDPGGFTSIGRRGCYESHLAVLDAAGASGAASVLIVEDDAELLPAYTRHAATVLDELDARPWDLVYLGWRPVDGAIIDPRVDTPEPSLVPTHARVRTTHCMAVNGPAIEAVAAHLRAGRDGPVGDGLRGPISVDGAYNAYCWLHPETVRLIAHPQLVGQRSSRSDITPNRWESIPALRRAGDRIRTHPAWQRRRARRTD